MNCFYIFARKFKICCVIWNKNWILWILVERWYLVSCIFTAFSMLLCSSLVILPLYFLLTLKSNKIIRTSGLSSSIGLKSHLNLEFLMFNSKVIIWTKKRSDFDIWNFFNRTTLFIVIYTGGQNVWVDRPFY